MRCVIESPKCVKCVCGRGCGPYLDKGTYSASTDPTWIFEGKEGKTGRKTKEKGKGKE